VGADQSLLTTWFETELTPLLDWHRSLTEASLRRKIAHFRESVIATLETLLANQRGGRLDDETQAAAFREQIRRLAIEGDAADVP
jgi:hypothetical protein